MITSGNEVDGIAQFARILANHSEYAPQVTPYIWSIIFGNTPLYYLNIPDWSLSSQRLPFTPAWSSSSPLSRPYYSAGWKTWLGSASGTAEEVPVMLARAALPQKYPLEQKIIVSVFYKLRKIAFAWLYIFDMHLNAFRKYSIYKKNLWKGIIIFF